MNSASFSTSLDLNCCSICFNEFTDEDPQASRADATAHGIVFACQHADMLHLSCLKKEALQRRPFQCPLCRTKFGFNKSCICGHALELRLVGKPIPGYSGCRVRCDHCARVLQDGQGFFHCPLGKSDIHPSGYDVCDLCAESDRSLCKGSGLFTHRESWRSSMPRRSTSHQHWMTTSGSDYSMLSWGNTQAVREGLLSLVRSMHRS